MHNTAPEQYDVVVLGMGNLLRSDEGVGVRAVQALTDRYTIPPTVLVVDGGTLGLDLIGYMESASRLLVLDAALTGAESGSMLRVADADVPAFLGMHSSPHEVALPDLLAVLQLRGTSPKEIIVLGMQPATIELGWDLSPIVAEHLPELVAAAVKELARWGFPLQERTAEEARDA
jgi:hydrogenase maturation protease